MDQSSEQAQLDAKTKELLGKLIKRNLIELKPILDKEGVHYTDIEKSLEDANPARVEGMLHNLEKEGILEAKVIDRAITCPDCSSPEAYSKYICLKCGSHNIEYTRLIEHMKCGYIGTKEKFTKDSFLVCPGCQAVFGEDSKDVTYREIGSCYQCEKCGYRFDKPEIIHLCQKCGRTFTYQDAKYVKIFSYRITNEAVKDLSRNLPIVEDVKDSLTRKGFDVQLHPQVKGASGVSHSFDLLAEKAGTRLAIDISIVGAKNDMISLLGKKVDVNPSEALIIDLSNLDELTTLGKVYGIKVFKAANNQEIPESLERFLTTFAEPETQEEPPETEAPTKLNIEKQIMKARYLMED